MKSLFNERPPPVIEDLARLSTVLATVDSSGKPFDAGQYRGLVSLIASTVSASPAGGALDSVLIAFPATAVIYENAHYARAGLCLASLELSMSSERLAVDAIARAMRREIAA